MDISPFGRRNSRDIAISRTGILFSMERNRLPGWMQSKLRLAVTGGLSTTKSIVPFYVSADLSPFVLKDSHGYGDFFQQEVGSISRSCCHQHCMGMQSEQDSTTSIRNPVWIAAHTSPRAYAIPLGCCSYKFRSDCVLIQCCFCMSSVPVALESYCPWPYPTAC